jgi:hypothetical protein
MLQDYCRTSASAATRVAGVPGAALGLVFGTFARLRRADKPLHPHGSLFTGTLERHGLTPPVGVAWIDDPGTDQVAVRLSRSLGLPTPLPDVHGLTLRVPIGESHADLLFATTGTGRISRYIFSPSVQPSARAYTTLLPYRAATGPLLLAAFPTDPLAIGFRLACASAQGPWRSFGRLQIAVDQHAASTEGIEQLGPDPTVSFDPVLNQLPGLPPYAWVASLREGAYVAARRARGSTSEAVR